ncbi:hypothetical protein [Novosphingobium album (ex Liu et al. 2023)]|uniref:Rap1a immunity protein domain-containing protein n=1 Tax=Novosphingobium album (ex Liu et al. 2023) TaxID=3031130 RepID=A0ABT5WP06_9SPHN|nr:hypothetical protein [Novosphingobium album (ex Liu et al. 2023)]MDE8651773.1 hypothetical protein [Novosphingobium album (ex Liu et al. 2023)]
MILPLAAASLAVLSPADEADLRCIAIFALSGAQKNAEKSEDTAGFVGAMMYFLGRIEGRTSGFDLEGQMTRLLTGDAYSPAAIEADAARCGQEMMQRGAELEKVGNALQHFGQSARQSDK